ncbi:hypothetical protein Phou_100230 [Phytohabitans houttuyneae]|uniref:Uncharacterized protein n=1 Tax=Phytohabitans houttuyneae TaxID=1076126 RepID=A0A6V8KL67_9ACTN|nr:hypothetical protein Phou_100230 [Phytohabitans houttuyneae]
MEDADEGQAWARLFLVVIVLWALSLNLELWLVGWMPLDTSLFLDRRLFFLVDVP